MSASVQVLVVEEEDHPIFMKEDTIVEEEEEDSLEEEVPSFRQKQRILNHGDAAVSVLNAIPGAQWKLQHLKGEEKKDSVRSILQETLATASSTSFSTIGSIVESVPIEEDDLAKKTEDVLNEQQVPRTSPRAASPESGTISLDEASIASLRAEAVQAIRDVFHHVVSASSSTTSPLKGSSTLLPLKPPMATRLLSHTSSVSLAVSTTANDTAAAQSNTLLLLTGPTGSGKTRLLHAALYQQTQASGGYYIRGKFDRLQHPDPYRVFSAAFTDWAHQVQQRGPAVVRATRDAIRAQCGSETCLLVSLIPALRSIFCPVTNGEETAPSAPPPPPNPNITQLANRHWNDDASQRFAFVFPMFLRAITSVPIVLVVDDLQWSDPCSLDVLCTMVTEQHPGLVIVSTYDGTYTNDGGGEDPERGTMNRHDDDDASAYLTQKLQDMEQNHALVVRTVSMENLSEPEVQQVLECTLSPVYGPLPPQLGPLIMEQTQGNLFSMDQLLKWLQSAHLLPRKGSSWNMERLQKVVREHAKLSGASAFYIQDPLQRLPVDMLDVLKVAACFGHAHMEDTLMEYVLDFPVDAILSQLVDRGILVMTVQSVSEKGGGNRYYFQHDNWQRAVYELIPEHSRELFHLEIGRRLWRRLSKEELDRNIYVILSQMIQGRRLITRATERYSVASLCWHAGRKAAKSSTFRVATIYLNFGIELLGESGWREEYDLTLSIYNAAAEMAMTTAHFDVMEELVESVLQHARSAGDKVAARATQLYALGVTDRQQEGLDLGLQLLSDLGSPLPNSFCRFTFFCELMSVKRLLRGKSNCYLKRLPSVDNEDVLASLQILNLMFLHALLVRPHLAPFISLMLMKLTLTHGLSFIAPLSFASYGMLCIKLNDIDAAFRFGELGIELLEQLQVREYIPRVYAAYYSCIYPFKYPARDSLDHLLYAHRVGLQTGDIEFSCLNANCWSFLSMDTGCPLDEIEHQWTIFQKTMKSHGQKSLLRMSIPCSQLTKYLRGKDVDFTPTESILQDCIANNLQSFASSIYWSKAQRAVIFNDWKLADEIAGIADLSRNLRKIPPTPEIVHVTFLNGMIAFVTLGRCSKDKWRRPRRQYMREGKNMLRSLERYSQMCPANYVCMKFLLEAEFAAVLGQPGRAMERYVCAISLAKDHGNFFIHALANERAGRYCINSLHQRLVAASYFEHSLLAYMGWSALRKVEHLRNELKELYDEKDFKQWFDDATLDSAL